MPTLSLQNRSRAICNMLPVLVQALTEPGTEGGAGALPGGGLPGASPQPQRGASPSSYGGRGGGLGDLTGTSGGTSGTGGGGGSTLNISEELSTQPVNTAPQAVTVGN